MSEAPPTLVILAGGSNSRFWPLKEKSLFTFCGTPLLKLQIQTLVDIGFRRIVVVGNSENQAQIQALGAELGDDLDFRVTVQHEARGMGDALLTLRPLLVENQPAFPAYVCQVHDVFDPSLHERMLQAHLQKRDTTWLASYRVSSYFPGGYLVLDDDARVIDIIEKPVPGTEPSDLMSLVAHVHPDLRLLLDHIEDEYDKPVITDDHYERAMSQLMQSKTFRTVPYDGPWHPIKYPWHVLNVMEYFLSSITPFVADDVTISAGVQLHGSVHVSAGTRILDGATIVGPTYIGPNSLIGQYSHVRGSMIGERCVIGVGSEVNRSYIGRGAQMHTAKALDSVLADSYRTDHHVNLSAGVITANFRGDGAHVRSTVKGERIDTNRAKLGAIIGAGTFVGIGAQLMPGVKIGQHSIIGPGTLVLNDVHDRTLHYSEQSYVTKPLGAIDDTR